MSLSKKRLRDLQRLFHIAGALAIGAFVYSPFGEEPAFRNAMRVVVVPLLTLTGLLMWSGPRLRRRRAPERA
jgi:hypothetical protein